MRTNLPCVSLLALAVAGLSPAATFAQSGIAGVVKDATGAVLPGVTVEASSPALIEKVRTAATDSAGLYRLVDLRPGTYAVVFTLPGFAVVRRENIELPAAFTATVNAEMRIGGIEETLTVSGQVPLVDVQSVATRSVLSNTLIEAIPSVRLPQSYAQYIPGVTGVAVGAVGRDTRTLSIHGGRAGDANVAIDGSPTRHIGASGGGADAYYVNAAIIEEISVHLGGASAEQQLGGVFTNVIPKEGSNSFSGLFYASYAGEDMQGDNLTEELRGRGLTSVTRLKTLSDVNLGLGGRLMRDKLWFYAALRHAENNQYIAGLHYNTNPLAWVYAPDLNRPAFIKIVDKDVNTRLTWQVTPKNKLGIYHGVQPHIVYQRNYSSTVSPEATTYTPMLPNAFTQITWKSPIHSRLLLEAAMSRQYFDYDTRRQTDPLVSRDTWAATELSTGMRFRAVWPVGEGYGHHPIETYGYKASASYLTGSHTLKVGVDLLRGSSSYENVETNGDIGVTLFNGAPRSLTLTAHPLDNRTNVNADLGVFVQDRWTLKQLTFDVGLRFDYFNSSVPEQHLPAGRFVPARDYAPVYDVPNWKDLAPRLGASYDLFGDGKTALKWTAGRYVNGAGAYVAAAQNPVNRAVTNITRTWSDSDGDFVPKCDLSNPAANGECGGFSDVNFGKANPRLTVTDDDVLFGFGKRGYNWETSAVLQRELLPGVSVDVGYYRRWYGNFTATDNLAVTPADYDTFCIEEPEDSRLPGGGGSEVCGLYTIRTAKFGQIDNFVTFTDNFAGTQHQVYNGVDVTVGARLPPGIQLSGGLSSGRTAISNCVVVDSPEEARFCDVTPPFLTQVKVLAVYPLPWWGLRTSAVMQSVPGPAITASYVATNTEVRRSLGRDLASGPNGTVTVELIPPGTRYDGRTNQVDFRISKIFQVGGVRILGNVDFFNVLNANGTQTLNTRFGPSWLQPTQIQSARYVQFGGQVVF